MHLYHAILVFVGFFNYGSACTDRETCCQSINGFYDFNTDSCYMVMTHKRKFWKYALRHCKRVGGYMWKHENVDVAIFVENFPTLSEGKVFSHSNPPLNRYLLQWTDGDFDVKIIRRNFKNKPKVKNVCGFSEFTVNYVSYIDGLTDRERRFFSEYVDQCSADPCGENAKCRGSNSSYSCQCTAGFDGNPHMGCTDFDECADGACSSYATCSNFPGSFNCLCYPGFYGNGFTCSDIDECSDGSATCGGNTNCSNTIGSHICECDVGFTGDPYSFGCTDIDECSDGSATCGGNAVCINSIGSHTCECDVGFNGNPYFLCATFPIQKENNHFFAPMLKFNNVATLAKSPLTKSVCSLYPGYEFHEVYGCLKDHKTVKVEWDAARSNCTSEGSDLFTPPESSPILPIADMQLTANELYWIGVRRSSVDGSIYERVVSIALPEDILDNSTLWGDNEPSRGVEECVIYSVETEFLHDVTCNSRTHFFICQVFV